jgi:O-acetyl-ADP-ribose deacetylase (regulator of RNase III)
VAVPGISTGASGFPRRLAAMLAVKTTKKWLDATNSGLQIVFVLRRRDQLPYYKAALMRYMKS